jgi:hypothetical protein
MKIHRRSLTFAASSLVAIVVACGSSSSSDDSSIPADASTTDATLGSDASTDAASSDAGLDAGLAKAPFDWVGVIGTGQSLSVGATANSMTTTQPFHNLKLVDTGPDPKYPIFPDSGAPVWATTPLVEPIRVHTAGPADGGYGDGQYPDNIAGETPHSGMANTLTTIWKARGGEGEYVTAHTVVGWSGNCLSHIDKEGGYRAYPASIEETRVWKSLAAAAGKTYGVGGLILTHGECDAGNADYGTGLYQFWQDYDADIKAITGQSRDPILFISQQSTIASGATGSAVQVWQQAVAHPGQIVVTGPKYQYGYNPGLLHLPAPGYEELGEKYAEIFDLFVNQNVAWKPLQPNKISRAGAVVTITFDVPNPPLVWDAHMPLAHQGATNAEWKNGKGFEVTSGATKLTISSATISGSTVVLTLSADPGAAAKVTVGYALTQDGTGTQGGTANGLVGSLRDSDPFVGWDAETIAANVTNGSTTITGAAGAFTRRATKDIVSVATDGGISADTVVTSATSDTQLTLSAPWSGATGTAMLSFRHDEYNYCVHFTMTQP